jgi:hypothetical protein
MIALNSSSGSITFKPSFGPAAGRPPPMTRAEEIWNLHRTIVNPTSDRRDVRRSKRALLIAWASPDKLFQADLRSLAPRSHKPVGHSQQSAFSVEAALS